MKHTISFISFLMLLGLTAFQCSDSNADGEQRVCCAMLPCSDVASLSGTWRLAGYQNNISGIMDNDPDTEGRGVVFTFTDSGKEGKITGHTVANEIEGAYTISSACELTIETFGGTKVGEPGWSGKAWLVSGATGSYKRNGNQLILGFQNGAYRMIFKKQ
ncbi:META domain-containing protein [Dyadobacter chenwenxiniae]|uniref:META domain-containing protein n=1 Tax=Dyadobacter chenwenxiniae TaxID=2906456 RepID=A0A9X1PQ92_9BACT|nr:META domain-containing protein [Dyadobacter chenwenxiniae]MCF0065445.1 META domain-containing protein [Dyadobacter chenwenxiniae]UON82146.1 META domain-containing protein [Dyadobacter chenwenxiniae]